MAVEYNPDTFLADAAGHYMEDLLTQIREQLDLIAVAGFLPDSSEAVAAVHTVRVSCRKIRAVIKFCKASLNRDLWRKVDNFCATALRLTAPVRDFDVLCLHAAEHLDGYEAENNEDLEDFLIWLESRRNRKWKRFFRKSCHSGKGGLIGEIEPVLGSVRTFRTTPGPLPRPDRKNKARLYRLKDAAGAILYQAAADITVYQTLLPDPVTNTDAAGNSALKSAVIRKGIHRLRLSVKNFRYVLEFFTPLQPAAVKDMLAELKVYQDQLGNWHDTVFFMKQIHKYAGKADCDWISQRLHSEEGHQRGQILDTWRNMSFSWFASHLIRILAGSHTEK